MENKKTKIKKVTSRVELGPSLFKQVEARRKKLRPVPKLKPFLEMLIEQGMQVIERNQMRARNLHVEPQPEGER